LIAWVKSSGDAVQFFPKDTKLDGIAGIFSQY
jgi:hypothetical protein